MTKIDDSWGVAGSPVAITTWSKVNSSNSVTAFQWLHHWHPAISMALMHYIRITPYDHLTSHYHLIHSTSIHHVTFLSLEAVAKHLSSCVQLQDQMMRLWRRDFGSKCAANENNSVVMVTIQLDYFCFYLYHHHCYVSIVTSTGP